MRAAYIATGLCVALGVGLGVPVQTTAGTKDECECDLRDQGDGKDGANVSNASECALTADHEYKWCTFEVQALKGSAGHQRSAAQADRAGRSGDEREAAGFLLSRLAEWDRRRQELMPREVERRLPEDAFGDLVSRLEEGENAQQLLSCMRTFFSGDGRALELSGNNALRCGVHPTGWLTVGFGFDDIDLFYILGPWASHGN